MRSLLLLATGLVLIPTAARAESPHPLRYIPAEANLVLRIEKPRLFVESITQHELARELQQLAFAREAIESTTFQRFMQLVRYYEQDLGMKWPDLLDRLAGNGITLAAKLPGDKAPVLVCIDGVDEDLAKRFLDLAIKTTEQELARQDSKEKLEKIDFRGTEGYKLGDLHMARIGPTLLVSNMKAALKRAVDLHHNQGKSLKDLAGPAEARKIVPANSLAWVWLDLDVARNSKEAKNVFAIPNDDPVRTIAVGGWVNVVKRAKFLAAALYKENDNFHIALRFPGAGYEGVPEALAVHVPARDQAASLEPLEPKGVMLSLSFHFDFNALWERKHKLFNDKVAKDFENGEKQLKKFLPGTTLGKLFSQVGSNHRVVIAHQEKTGYGVKPNEYAPNFAIVTTMRDPEFSKSMNTILRSAALLGGLQANLKLVEESHAGVKIVGYRFPETGSLPNDAQNYRFNFSPCFAVVGDQFLGCSTIEFAREMVELLQKEALSSDRRLSHAPLQLRLYSGGAVNLLKGFEDQVLGQIILDQAVKPAEGKKQLDQLSSFLAKLGRIEMRSEYGDKEYRFDIEWKVQESHRKEHKGLKGESKPN